MPFLFPSDEALLFALTAGLVPPAVAAAPARTGRDSGGRPWVGPVIEVTAGLATAIRRIGVGVTDAVPPGGRNASHWPEAIPLHRDPVPPAVTAQTPVLFELPDVTGLAGLVGEMLRLGNDRQSLRMVAGSPVLRVVGPPYYTLLRALDRLGTDAPRAYLERAPGVWVEAGWTHPLIGMIRPPAGQLLLLRPPHEWTAIGEAPFRDVYELLRFDLPGRPVAWGDAAPDEKLTVPLRFAPATAEQSAELWMFRGPAVAQIDDLVRDADVRRIARLAFAVGEHDGERIAILRPTG